MKVQRLPIFAGMELFYHPAIFGDTEFSLDEAEQRHLRVLRIKDGDLVSVTDGKGCVFSCRVHFTKRNAMLRVVSKQKHAAPTPALTLAVAATKNMDRMEWMVEKAVEIGVDCIQLMRTKHSERPDAKTERLTRVAVSAIKQSGKYFLPAIKGVKTMDEVISASTRAQKFIAHCHAGIDKVNLAGILKREMDTLICIGPEGDFSEEEINKAIACGFTPVSLGPSILRTETAAIAAVHTFYLANIA